MSAAVTVACNCVALTNVVVRADPFHLTVELLINPLPFTIRLNPTPPALAEDGERELIDGTGLLRTVMVPPLPETVAAVASANVPKVDPTEIGIRDPLDGVNVTVRTAAIPAAIVFEFIPEAM